MWCETSDNGQTLGIHLGMGGRIVVTSQDGQVAWGGEPFRRDAQPPKAEWDRFTLSFADGGSLVLFDNARLGRVRLNPGIDALGPDAAEDNPKRGVPRPDHQGVGGGQGPAARPVQDRRRGEPAGRRDPLAGSGAHRPRGRQPAARGHGPAVSRARVGAAVRDRQGRGAHRRRHRGPASRRDLPAVRGRDAARNGRRPLHLVVFARAVTRRKGRRPRPFGIKIFDPERTGCLPRSEEVGACLTAATRLARAWSSRLVVVLCARMAATEC